MKNKYDYLIIGSGPAGYASAIRAAQLGLRTAVAEKDMDMLGGVCLNEGCVPAKSLYHSAEIVDVIGKNKELCAGVALSRNADMSPFVRKSREAAGKLRRGLTYLFKKNGIDLISGVARFVDKETVRICADDTEPITVKAAKILIASGSFPRPLPLVAFDPERVISSSQAIRLDKVPEKLLVVGAGAAGVEFASFFNMLGAQVSIVEVEKHLLPPEDNEVSRCLESVFRRRGITVHASSTVKDVSVGSDGVEVTIRGEKDLATEKHDTVLVAIGRVPAAGNMGLEKAGVETDGEGFVPVDAEMRTNVKNIYAAGDVLRTPMLAHMAYAEGETAAESAAGVFKGGIDYGSVPNVVYTSPQVASVGMTEEEAKSGKRDFAVGRQFFKACGKAVISLNTEGFIKVIADRKNRKLLGVHIIGHEAAELIHEFVVAKRAGLTVEDIERAVHAHPTFSETAVDACRAVFGKPIHG